MEKYIRDAILLSVGLVSISGSYNSYIYHLYAPTTSDDIAFRFDTTDAGFPSLRRSSNGA